jgi:hypothetical protein
MAGPLEIHASGTESIIEPLQKRSIYGCCFHVSEAHPHRYLAEFDSPSMLKHLRDAVLLFSMIAERMP